MRRDSLPATAGGVRTKVEVPLGATRRTLEERILVRLPGLVRPLASAWARLPPTSRLRRAWLARVVAHGCAAANRKDYDVVLLTYDREVELDLQESPLGHLFTGIRVGRDRWRETWLGVREEIDDLTLLHEEVIDFGDHMLMAGRTTGFGSSSRVPINEPIFQLFTLRRGLVTRQRDFADRERALRAINPPVAAKATNH
jgi:hypothetical protein